ncbi:BON domain-containing protein [Aliikangiella marina]|uniref:BON domain-containing protein n=1 Tax=Aliikangiella marina TaxID=1712262 RepID=A0A545T6K0_9GAMM|nr:BON domain-containing protein [Aliikangiella marina]TQV72846.1 BON domain-containing protein [Aliikangiella marina]
MKRLAIITLVILSTLLSGCETLIIAGATTSAYASQDRRDFKTQIEDQNTEFKTFTSFFDDDELWDNTNINVISYNNVVLIVGQAPTATLKQRATEEIKKIAKDNKIHNQIRIAAPISFFARRNDEFLTTKVKSSMLFTSDFPASKIKVVTENSEVFLLGLVTTQEADQAVEITRNIDGVKKVVKVFEYISEES